MPVSVARVWGSSRARHRPAIWPSKWPSSAAIACVLTTMLAGAAVAYYEPTDSVVLLVALGLVLVLPNAVKITIGTFDPFEPIFLFAIAYGAMFIVRPLAVLLSGDFEYPIGVGSVDFSSGFKPMLILGLLGGVGFVLGYLVPLGRMLARCIRPPMRTYNPAIAGFAAGVFAFLGVGLFLLFLVFAGGVDALLIYVSGRSYPLTQILSETSKYLVIGPIILLPASVMLLALGTKHRSVAMVGIGLFAALVLVLIAAPTGRRSWLFPLGLSIAIYFYVTHGRRPSFKGVVTGLMLLLALSALVGTVRSADVRRTIGVSQSVRNLADDPSRIFQPLTTGADASLATGLAALLSMPPDRYRAAYPGQAVVGDLFTRAVPRSLWAEKPEPPRQKAARALFGRNADIFFANPEFSVIFYPYLDGGQLAVLLFMMIYGCLARALYEYAMLHQTNVAVRLGFALLLPVVVAGVRDSSVDTVARVMFVMAPLALAFGLARALNNAPSRENP